MNLYFLVEGERTEKQVYRSWLGHVFPGLRFVDRPEDVTENCIRLIVGAGYPQYLDRIGEALAEIENVVQHRIDHFFVCVDAEERSFETCLAEVDEQIEAKNPVVRYTVVIQMCCMETWFLGNRAFVKENPRGERLRRYRQFYDVRKDDPEHMEAMPPWIFRAHFHEDYLKATFRERNQTYTKKRPGRVLDPDYFQQLVKRYQVGHLQSFGRLVEAWRELGGEPRLLS